MYNAEQLRLLIIRPTLSALALYSPEAEELMMGTCAHESKGGTFLKQENGPALGAWQMEPATHDDIWKNYLPHQTVLASKLINFCRVGVSEHPRAEYMIYHLNYACSMARILYHRKHAPMPKTLEEQAQVYVEYYNAGGKATVEEYIDDYRRFVGKVAATPSSTKAKGK